MHAVKNNSKKLILDYHSAHWYPIKSVKVINLPSSFSEVTKIFKSLFIFSGGG